MSKQEEQEILPLLMLLWSRKMFIGSLVLFGCLIGSLHALSKYSVYQADSLIQLETKDSGISLSENITELMSNESEAITEIEIIKSRMVLGETVKELQLDIVSEPKSLPILANFLSAISVQVPDWEWLSSYGLRGEELEIDSLIVDRKFIGQPLMVQRISETVYQIVDPDGKTTQGVIGEKLIHPDSYFEVHIAAIHSKVGVEFTLRKQAALAAVNRLRQAVKVVEKGRNSNLLSITVKDSNPYRAREILDSILRNYVAQNVGRSSEEAEKSLDFLNDQLPIVLDDLSLAESELNEFRLKHESINLDLESASVLDQMVTLEKQITELSLQEAELSRLFTKDHPRYDSLLKKRVQLLDQKDALTSIVHSFPEVQQEIVKRTRNLEVNQHIYLQLLNKKQELDVMKASVVGSVRVIDSAMTNPVPVGPGRYVSVVLSALLLFCVGCGYVLLRFFLERNVDSPEEITKLGVPVYATVPRSAIQDKHTVGKYILSRDDPSELTVESLRSLRTSLHFGMPENGRGIISITGPSPEIGKSFVASNLAYLAADSGSKVLLIDADMRRGTVGSIFGIRKKKAGLSEFLTGTADLDQVMNTIKLAASEQISAVTKNTSKQSTLEPELEAVLDGIDLIDSDSVQTGQFGVEQAGGLVVIPRGSAPPNPSELLMKERMDDFLSMVSETFDLIIIDTPPVLAATDAMIVGRHADMNLMVVRHNKTSVHEMEEVVKAFTVNSVDLSGAVLNNYDHQNGKFGQYSYAYGYQYSYESTD